MYKFIANIICIFVVSKTKKRNIRMNIRYRKYIKSCIKFVRLLNNRHCKIKQFFGYGCQNMMISLNNKYIYKFPLPVEGKINNDKALREFKIYKAFKSVSPIRIPNLTMLKFNDIIVRRYEYISGCKVLSDFSPKEIEPYKDNIAKQIANFLYIIGKFDPKDVAFLKYKKDLKPGFLYGWCQNDIGGNFLIDIKTKKIKSVIDWEDTDFTSFKPMLYSCSNYWENLGYRGLIVDVLDYYTRLYYKNSI